MRIRLRSVWFSLQETLWFIPAVMTVTAIVMAFFLLTLDREVLVPRGVHAWWLFEGGAEGARGVLTTIAGTMITVATTAFSITIVALQLGSSQFSPRILRGFTADRGNQLVLGTFISTFAYSVVILRSVRSDTEVGAAFIPPAAVSVAILLAFTAIGSLIYFFHHATRAIQASVVIERTSQDLFGLIDRRLASDMDANQGIDDPIARSDVVGISLGRSGYVTSIDTGALAAAGGRCGLVLTLCVQVGMHVRSNTSVVMLTQQGSDSIPPDDWKHLESAVHSAFSTGLERTLEHDLLLGFRQLSDIAVKAMSPGINDPTTATSAIYTLGEALYRVREFRDTVRYRAAGNGNGGVRIRSIGLRQVLDECLPQIGHYSAGDDVVVTHLLRVLEGVGDGASPEVVAKLATSARLVEAESVETLILEASRDRVRAAAGWAHLDGHDEQ